MWIYEIFYWGFNQYIIQRALAAKRYARSAKGHRAGGVLEAADAGAGGVARHRRGGARDRSRTARSSLSASNDALADRAPGPRVRGFGGGDHRVDGIEDQFDRHHLHDRSLPSRSLHKGASEHTLGQYRPHHRGRVADPGDGSRRGRCSAKSAASVPIHSGIHRLRDAWHPSSSSCSACSGPWATTAGAFVAAAGSVAVSIAFKIYAPDVPFMDRVGVVFLACIAVRNAKRLDRLASDILDVTKIESNSLKLEKTYFNLNDILSNSIRDIQNQVSSGDIGTKNLKIVYDPVNIRISGDKERINQVISNLLSNALKFTDEGFIKIEVENSNDNVIISVEDTGSGIHPEIFPRLFCKFATKSDKGTGLGLYISKNIIDAHGGRIWAQNNKSGIGATFFFSIPLDIEKIKMSLIDFSMLGIQFI